MANKRKKRKKKGSLHLATRIAFLGILLAILVIVGLLLLWNRGTRSTYSADDVSTDYETEELDQVFYVADEALASSSAASDDALRILFLGNAFLTDGEAGRRIPDLIEDALRERYGTSQEVQVLCAAVPGSRMAPRSAQYDALYPYDLVSFLYTGGYIANGDFTFFERYVTDYAAAVGEAGAQAAQTLQGADFDTLDMLVIAYDAVDYLEGTPVFNPDEDYDPVTYCGALRAGVMAVKERYPHIRIVFLFPTFCYITGEDGAAGRSDIVDIGNGDLTTYLIKAIDVCQDEGISIVDNYSGTIDDANADRMLLSDGITLTDEARRAVAEHFMRVIFP